MEVGRVVKLFMIQKSAVQTERPLVTESEPGVNSLYQEFENVNRMKLYRYNLWWIYLEFTVVFLKTKHSYCQPKLPPWVIAAMAAQRCEVYRFGPQRGHIALCSDVRLATMELVRLMAT